MKVQKITTDPDPYEPFHLAQGYRVGELLFISGQVAIDGNGQLVGVGNFDAQAEQVFANLERVLRAGGSPFSAARYATAARFSMIERQASASSLPLVTMCARKKSW